MANGVPGSGGVIGNIMTLPAYGTAGPNFIVRENVGYLSREEIRLKQNTTDPMYPEGLILKHAAGGGPEVLYEAFDGTGDAAGILYQMRDVSKGDTSAVAIVRAAEVQRAMLIFAEGVSDAQKEQAFATLADVMITLR